MWPLHERGGDAPGISLGLSLATHVEGTSHLPPGLEDPEVVSISVCIFDGLYLMPAQWDLEQAASQE